MASPSSHVHRPAVACGSSRFSDDSGICETLLLGIFTAAIVLALLSKATGVDLMNIIDCRRYDIPVGVLWAIASVAYTWVWHHVLRAIGRALGHPIRLTF